MLSDGTKTTLELEKVMAVLNFSLWRAEYQVFCTVCKERLLILFRKCTHWGSETLSYGPKVRPLWMAEARPSLRSPHLHGASSPQSCPLPHPLSHSLLLSPCQPPLMEDGLHFSETLHQELWTPELWTPRPYQLLSVGQGCDCSSTWPWPTVSWVSHFLNPCCLNSPK